MESIFDLIGPTVPHHATVVVQPGRMITAVAFFCEFLGGWKEIENTLVEGDWGVARFVESTYSFGCFRVQLSEPKGDLLPVDSSHHLAIRVKDAQLAAHLIVEYFNANMPGESTAEHLPGGKYWLVIPELFATPIEFVPM